MNLQKAIEILKDLRTDLPQFSPDDRREAVMLGEEALKRVQSNRQFNIPTSSLPLPGETED